MVHTDQSTLILAPLAASHAHKPVVRTLNALHNLVRAAEDGPYSRIHKCAVRVVPGRTPVRRAGRYVLVVKHRLPHTFQVWRLGIELLRHVFSSELAKSSSLKAEEFEHLVNLWEV